jgi:hypothetical protein
VTIALPAELAGLADALGVDWPDVDEDALYATALRWVAVAAALREREAGARMDLRRLLAAERAAGSLAHLVTGWAAPRRRFAAVALAADTLAGCLLTLASVVCELKRYVLARLADLAAVLATAEHTSAYPAAVLTGAALRRATRTAGGVVDTRLVPVLEAATRQLTAV